MDNKYYLIVILLLIILSILMGFEIVTSTTQVEDAVSEPTIIVEEVVDVEIKKEVAFELSEYERWVVECIVMGEAGGESYKGKILVAQCILNACLREDIQPSTVRTRYKYSGWKEDVSDDVKSAVSEVFDDGYKAVDEPILYFYAPKYVHSAWHETQRHVITEGGHKFFALWED